ncbi:hypothetical protein KMT30_06705, partial [Streptomyces sp. IBSBF 2953]|nr:hypothetical protein [Streptomyces hayashii]
MTTFTDDFNRSDGTSLGASWVEVSGDWSIASNQLSPGAAGGTIILRAAGAMATSDHYAQVTIAATAAVSHGVWCRGNSTISQGYLWRNDGSNWSLFSVVGGSFSSIGSYAVAAVAGDVAKIQAVGSLIKGFVNGIERVSVVNTAVATGTSVGIRSESTSAIRFDNFTGADIATGGSTGDTALTGTASLSASGSRGTGGSSALTATATLSAAGLRATTGDSALTATAGLAASGQRGAAGDAALAATAGLTTSGIREASGAAALAVSATLTGDGTVTKSADSDLAVTADLAASGVRDTPGAAALTATAVLDATGTAARRLDTALAVTAALTATAAKGAAGGGSLAIEVALHASGQVDGAVVRGTLLKAAAAPVHQARRGESAVPRAQAGRPAQPT